MNKHHPYHPIIYIRGFAATHDEIEETVADPYMGFNLGSTKTRQVWDGKMRKFFFESPLVRLKDEIVWVTTNKGNEKSNWRYDDVYVDGDDLTAPDPEDQTKPLRPDIALPYQSIVIFRYYDAASEVFGTGDTPPIEHFAQGLSDLILRLRELVCRKGVHPITGEPLDNEVALDDFRVYLIAHSMGGLVCRAFLQNPDLGSNVARKAVDKVFTYATPHNGIDLRIVRNVPGWATFGDVNNFNRKRMAAYLAVPQDTKATADDIDVSVVTNFPPDRIFNLVGTNPSDYIVMRGISAWAAGEVSDGLVRIENATTHGPDPNDKDRDIRSPRAFTYRSHSGHYGIVNSEEGYQNLTRFFFGSLRVDGFLDIDNVSLPDKIQQGLDSGRKIRASYQFEIVVSMRGQQWQMHRRTVRENSAIHRTFDELFPDQQQGRKPDRNRSPHLFSVFLDPRKSTKEHLPLEKRSVAFAFDLAVLVPDYQVDGILWLDRHYEGGYIYRELILVEATPDAKAPGGWKINYGYQSRTPNFARTKADTQPLDGGGITFDIKVIQAKRPGINATLRIEARPWNSWK
ncbi:lipase family alpha/beta hydrolase [Methylomicrobium lacus]|uniref:lipase family alpha/beta hydrolase n=1 Tax=Methylomicrobium lacus TaxID=136992 RepID=UPI0035A987E7